MSEVLTREQALAYLKAATNQHDVYSMEKVMAHDAALRAKLDRFKTMSTVEMMCENLNIDAHVREWEARCIKAEAKLAQVEEQLRQQITERGLDLRASELLVKQLADRDAEIATLKHQLSQLLFFTPEGG